MCVYFSNDNMKTTENLFNALNAGEKRRKIRTAFDFPLKEATSGCVLEARWERKGGLHRI